MTIWVLKKCIVCGIEVRTNKTDKEPMCSSHAIIRLANKYGIDLKGK